MIGPEGWGWGVMPRIISRRRPVYCGVMATGRLEGRVCIVTGSTAGIGRATAERFAAEGGSVVVSGRRKDLGEEIAAAIRERGQRAIFVRCDVGVDAEMDALVARTVEEFGGLDVLVNNAAAVDEGHSYNAEDLDPDSWDRQLRVNVRSVYYLSRLAIPHLRSRGGGAIVNVSSVGSLVVWENAAAYLTSKGAMNQLTRSMAIDFQPDEIRVNAVLPGWIRTEVEEKRLAENPNAIEEALAVRSIRRLGKPGEIASAALFLASEDASYVTGTCLVVDGGWTLS